MTPPSTTRTHARRSHKHHLPRTGKSDDYGDDSVRGAVDGKYEYSSRQQDREPPKQKHLSKSGALQHALSLSLRLRGL